MGIIYLDSTLDFGLVFQFLLIKITFSQILGLTLYERKQNISDFNLTSAQAMGSLPIFVHFACSLGPLRGLSSLVTLGKRERWWLVT